MLTFFTTMSPYVRLKLRVSFDFFLLGGAVG